MSDGEYINYQEEQERLDAVERSRGSWLGPMVAGIGTIALGAIMLKSRLAAGGNLTKNIFNLLGIPKGITLDGLDAASNIGKSATHSNTAGVKSILTNKYNVARNKVHIGPIDLIDDLRTSLEIMARNPADVAEHVAAETTEFINREFSNHGNNTGYFTKNLERVTFGNVLADQAAWANVLTPNQLGIIKKSVDLGIAKETTLLDQKIFFNPNTREVLDLRLRNLLSKVVEVPTSLGSSVQRVPRFDLLGQGEIISSIIGAHRRVAVLGSDAAYTGSRIFIDGNIYGYSRLATGGYQPVLLAENRALRRTGDALEAIAASRAGRIEYNLPERSGFFGSMLGWIENNLGIGPAFATRPTLLERVIINPIKRFRALQQNTGVVFEHPFQKQFGISKVLDAAVGGEYPELAARGGNTIPRPGGGYSVDIENLQGRTLGIIPNRIGVLFDITDNYSIVKQSSYRYLNESRTTLIGEDLIVPPKKGGYTIRGRQIPASSAASTLTDIDRGELTAAGFRSITPNYAYYDVAAHNILGKRTGIISGIKDFIPYMFQRLNNLFSETGLGIAMAPSHKLTTNIARTIGIYGMYSIGLESAKYLDYLSEKFTGISPIKAAASVYAGARVAQQYIRNAVGLSGAMQVADTYFPGSVTSEGSTVIRSILAPAYAANFFLKRGSFAKAAISAIGTYAAIGGAAPQQTYTDLIKEYSGEKKVPVRQGAWWGMGYTPFAGGKPTRYDYSWYAKLASDYRVKSIYGSKEEYWNYHSNVMGIPFPTPSNLFGLKNLLNPYRLESMHYYDRPYPQTEPMFSSFPIIGPALGATIGQVFKPTRYRENTDLPLLKAALAPQGLTANTAKLYGIPAMNATAYEAEDPGTALNVLAKQANIATEPLGIYKFALEFFGVKFDDKQGRKYATSGMIADPARQLYDLGIAGGLGQTEALRRFLLSDYGTAYNRAQYINPIRNNMPDWLPGTYSSSARDQTYFLDFTQGDPYCVSANSLVETHAGLVTASSVGRGTIIKTHKNNWKPVIKTIKRPVTKSEKVYEIYVTSLSTMPVRLSEEHPLWTPEGWTEAADLKIGDYVGYPIPSRDENLQIEAVLDLSKYTSLPYTKSHIYLRGTQEYADCVEYLENNGSNFNRGELKKLISEKNWNRTSIENAQRGIKNQNIKRINRYVDTSAKQWGVISGYWLSEGSTNGSSLSFAFHVKEDDFINELNDAFVYLFNISGKKYNSNQICNNRISNGCSYVVTNKALAEIIPRIWGSGYDKKHLYPQHKDSIKETIRTLFNGDGSYYFDNSKPRLALKLRNPRLLWEVRQELLKFEIVSYLLEDQIVIRGQAAKDAAILLGTKYKETEDSKKLARHSYIKDGYVWLRVFNKKEVQEDFVFGFEIPDDDSFCVGGIATHNTKIEDGESRLPGEGYESLNELHSGVPGQYSDVDRFLILSDVAPYSNAYKRYLKKVTSMQLEDKWAVKVNEAIEQRKQVISVDNRYKRYEEDLIALNEGLTNPAYAGARKVYDFITHDILAEIPYIGSKFFPFRSPYEQYRKTRVEGEEFASWDRPYEGIIRPGIYDMAYEDPITAAGKGATLGFLMSGPMRWFTPIRSIVGFAGGHSYNIAAVKGGAMLGAAISSTRILAGESQDSLPPHIVEEDAALRYIDTLSYVKKRILGEAGIATRENTLLGAKTPISYRSALPTSSDRRYFDYFSQVTNEDLQEQIIKGSPSYMSEGLTMVWNSSYTRQNPDEVALEFLNTNQIPDDNWLGWHANISNAAVKLKMINHGINGISDNIHRYGFFDQHEIDMETRLAEFSDQEIVFQQSPIHASFNSFLREKAKKFSGRNQSVSLFSTPLGARRELRIQEDSTPAIEQAVKLGYR